MDPVARAVAQRIAQQARIAAPSLTSLQCLSGIGDKPADEDVDRDSTVPEATSQPLEPQLTPAVALVRAPPIFFKIF